MSFQGFHKELFTFLKQLAANNERGWFNANKDKYIRFAKEPTLQFIVAMKDRLTNISESYIADPRPNGGSMFRIYRDTRFSKDKRPYKENIGCQFRHIAGKDAHAPGFYVHIAPGDSFAGGGIWLPPSAVLNKIRDGMDRDRDGWLQCKRFIAENEHMDEVSGERLKRPPRGFAEDHPLIEDLKLKTIFSGRSFKDSEVVSEGFIDAVEAAFHDLAPLMRFVNEALDLSFLGP